MPLGPDDERRITRSSLGTNRTQCLFVPCNRLSATGLVLRRTLGLSFVDGTVSVIKDDAIHCRYDAFTSFLVHSKEVRKEDEHPKT